MRIINYINFVSKYFFPFFFLKLVPLIIEDALQALKRLLKRLDEIFESKLNHFYMFNF